MMPVSAPASRAETRHIVLTVNGEPVELDVAADERLVDILRERLHIMGPKVGCRIGRCGVCTVLVNGKSMNGCLVMAYRLNGAEVHTAEGLHLLPEGKAVIGAFTEGNAFQCGYCAPGMAVSMTSLLLAVNEIDDAAIREGLGGNICRCTGYHSILRAARDAVAKHDC